MQEALRESDLLLPRPVTEDGKRCENQKYFKWDTTTIPDLCHFFSTQKRENPPNLAKIHISPHLLCGKTEIPLHVEKFHVLKSEISPQGRFLLHLHVGDRGDKYQVCPIGRHDLEATLCLGRHIVPFLKGDIMSQETNCPGFERRHFVTVFFKGFF